VQAILRSDLHVIATMRSKTSYAMDEVIEDGRKRTKVVKQGMAPIQRDGFEYEFDVFIDMDIDNNAIVTKTRCPALTGKVFPSPRRDVAEILAAWLKGQPAPEPPPTDPSGQGHDPAGGGNGTGGGGQALPVATAIPQAATAQRPPMCRPRPRAGCGPGWRPWTLT
jgi:hypothetical protein